EALPHRPAVFLSYEPQHLPPKPRIVRAIRCPPRTAVLQTGSPFFPVALPQSLGLSVAHAHQSACIQQPQLLALHSRQHFHPSQLPLAHLCAPQSDLLPEALLGDISIEHKRGHYHRGTTQRIVASTKPSSSDCRVILGRVGSDNR